MFRTYSIISGYVSVPRAQHLQSHIFDHYLPLRLSRVLAFHEAQRVCSYPDQNLCLRSDNTRRNSGGPLRTSVAWIERTQIKELRARSTP